MRGESEGGGVGVRVGPTSASSFVARGKRSRRSEGADDDGGDTGTDDDGACEGGCEGGGGDGGGDGDGRGLSPKSTWPPLLSSFSVQACRIAPVSADCPDQSDCPNQSRPLYHGGLTRDPLGRSLRVSLRGRAGSRSWKFWRVCASRAV